MHPRLAERIAEGCIYPKTARQRAYVPEILVNKIDNLKKSQRILNRSMCTVGTRFLKLITTIHFYQLFFLSS